MKVKRTLTILAALLAVAGIVMSASAADVYFYGIANGRLFPCTYNYMPMDAADDILCPAQLLVDAGMGFRVEYGYPYYTIYTHNKAVTFDLVQGYAFDTKYPYDNIKVTRKNGVFYLPLEFVSKYFRFEYSKVDTAYGTAVIIKAGDDTTENDFLIDALDEQLARAQGSYLSVNPTPAPPAVSTTPTPTPTPRPAPSMYLSFDVSSLTGLRGVLNALDEYGISAVFFVTPEFAQTSHDGLRRIIGGGHSLGILLSEEMPDLLESAETANASIRAATLTQTRLAGISVQGGELSEGDSEALEQKGYRLWGWKIDAGDWKDNAKPDTTAKNLLAEIEKTDGACYVRFSCGQLTVDTLGVILPELEKLDASYYTITQARSPYR